MSDKWCTECEHLGTGEGLCTSCIDDKNFEPKGDRRTRMTRVEAIEILKAHHMWTGEPQEIIDVRKENKALDMAIKALSQEPTKEEQALLQKWRDNRGISIEEFEDAMNTLQEPCDYAEQIDYHDDFATALKKMQDYEEQHDDKRCGNCKLIGTDSCYMVCGGSKSLYKPKQKIEPCDDAVSREKVLEMITDFATLELYIDKHNHVTFEPLEKLIKSLPSVTQKSGKWHRKYDRIVNDCFWECDKCGCGYQHEYNYCPNCGARMESETEE